MHADRKRVLFKVFLPVWLVLKAVGLRRIKNCHTAVSRLFGQLEFAEDGTQSQSFGALLEGLLEESPEDSLLEDLGLLGGLLRGLLEGLHRLNCESHPV